MHNGIMLIIDIGSTLVYGYYTKAQRQTKEIIFGRGSGKLKRNLRQSSM